MNLQPQQLQAIIVPFLASVDSIQSDPLIDRGAQTVVRIGVALIAVLLVFIVWRLSPKLEHAIVFAALVSIALIAFFVI